MAATQVKVQMQQRRDTAAGWTSANPILLEGELGFETDTKKAKLGDGSTAWNSLAYYPGFSISAYPLATADIADDAITAAKLANTSVTAGSYTAADITVDAQGRVTAAASGSLGTSEIADGAITTAKIADSAVTTAKINNDAVTADKLADTAVTAGSYTAADITVDAQGRITSAASGTIGTSEIADDAVTSDKLANDITIANDLTVTNDLTVNGTTTTINSTTLQVDDKNIELGTVASPSDSTANGGGITLKGATDHTIVWTNSTDSWDFSEHVNIASGKEFKIAGTSVLSATTLGSAVVNSSLTSVGTIATGVWNGTAIATAYIADDAVTADKLANTAVTAGSYTAADITVDAQGRITAAASGTISTAEIADDAVTADKLADTAVTAGSYTLANITVDAQGRLTAAASGTAADSDKITEGNTEAEVVDTGSDGHFKVSTEGSERLRVDSSGRLLVARTSSTGSNEDIQDSKGGIRAIPQNSKTSAYTLVVGDVGKHINITTGGVTVPSGVFSTGDAVTIYNDSASDQTVTQGSSVTLRSAGTADTGNRTLAQRGICTVLCVASNEFVVSGAGLS